MAIYTILHRTTVPPKSPYFSIANMVNFGLATWYGVTTKNKESSKISILNGIRAILELAKTVSIIYRHRGLARLATIAAEAYYSAVICFGIFLTFELSLDGKAKEYFFASVSTCVSSIMLIIPLFTLGEEPVKWFAIINAIVETIASILWMLDGVAMVDIPTIITSSVGIITNMTAAFRLGNFQELQERRQELELQEQEWERRAGVRLEQQEDIEMLKRTRSL